MIKIAKAVRIMTVAPIIAFILINILHFKNNGSFLDINYFVAIFTLVLLPLLAYPIQSKFTIFSRDKRSSERKLAIIFSVIGYILGLSYSFIFNAQSLEKIVYLTYLLSGTLITLFTFLFKVNASGHMCGVMGPIAIIVYIFGPLYLFLITLLIIVIWSSLYLKRHNIGELIIGSIIPIISIILAITIFK